MAKLKQDTTTTGMTIELPDELIERIAQRAAEIVAERLEANGRRADRWIRGAADIAAYIGSTRSRVYALAECRPPRVPIHKEGSALIARTSELDAWIESGGGRAPAGRIKWKEG